MKKILLVAVALSLAFTVKAFATETKKATEVKPATTATQTVKTTEPAKTATTTATKVETKATEVTKTAAVTPTKVETKPVTTTTSLIPTLKGNITKLDNTNVWLKDNAGKEWTFKVGTISMKDYKVGDNVEVKYEKDNLKSIAKTTTK